MWLIFYICIGYRILSATSSNVEDMRAEADTDALSQRLSEILRSYDIRLRPNFAADPLYIGIDMTIANFNEISEVNMDYTITILLNQYWKDERLAFSTRDDDSITFTGEFAERIWVPDIFFPADKDSFLHDVTEKNKMVRLQGDGSIMYGMRFTTTQSCQMNLRDYPLDTQNCTVEIESYGYTVRDVVMYWKERPVSGVEDIKLPQYIIAAYDTTDRTENLATGIYQRLSLSFKLQRNFGYFFFQMYLPSILIVMLSWVSFCLVAGLRKCILTARVALGITTVLTMTTINNSVRSSLPRISYVKAIDIYLVMCFLFVFAALIEYAAVSYIFSERKKVRKRKEGKKAQNRFQSFQLKPTTGKGKRTKLGRLKTKLRLPSLSRVTCPTKTVPSKCSIEICEEEAGVGDQVRPAEGSTRWSAHLSLPQSRLGRSSSFSGAIGLETGRAQSRVPTKYPVGWRKRQLVQSIRNQAKAIEHHLPTIAKDVSSVDNFSRIFFPCSFLLFNAVYWSVYINKS